MAAAGETMARPVNLAQASRARLSESDEGIAGKPYQYIKAAGQGNVAALSAVEYLDKKKREKQTDIG